MRILDFAVGVSVADCVVRRDANALTGVLCGILVHKFVG